MWPRLENKNNMFSLGPLFFFLFPSLSSSPCPPSSLPPLSLSLLLSSFLSPPLLSPLHSPPHPLSFRFSLSSTHSPFPSLLSSPLSPFILSSPPSFFPPLPRSLSFSSAPPLSVSLRTHCGRWRSICWGEEWGVGGRNGAGGETDLGSSSGLSNQ